MLILKNEKSRILKKREGYFFKLFEFTNNISIV